MNIGVIDGKCEGVVLGYTQGYFTIELQLLLLLQEMGMAAALRAGLDFEDPEMMQFYPIGVANEGTLITEAARGEGGYLLNNRSKRFMKNYYEKMKFAPQDVVVRAIETEICEGRGYAKDLELMFCAMCVI